jgi:hypothetical protein
MLSSWSFLLDDGSVVKGFPGFPFRVCGAVLIGTSRALRASCELLMPGINTGLAVAFNKRWSGAKR